MILRDYQPQAVTEARAALAEGKRPLIVIPTGGGKSLCGKTIGQDYQRPLWAVPSTALKDQAPGRAATVQSMLRGHMPDADLIIVDEAHRVGEGAAQWFRVIQDFKGPVVGMTATPQRHTGEGLDPPFDHLIVTANYSELIAAGHLVDCKVTRPVDAPEEETGLAEHPIKAWRRYANNEPTFAFFGRVEAAEKFATALNDGPLLNICGVIHGGQAQAQRDETMSRFRAGDLRVLASVSCLSEGVDCPAASVALLAVMPQHCGSFLQRVGRVLRPAPGKAGAHLIDLSGASFCYGLPTENREYSLDGQPISRTEAALSLSQCLQCGAVYPGAPNCPRCGWERPAVVRPPRIWGAAMETLDPAALSPKDRAKLSWKQRMLDDPDARLAWLQKRAKSGKHAYVMHLKLFGCKMPGGWFRVFSKKAGNAT